MGLALARHFAVKGKAVTVFEREKQLGGLTTYHDYGLFFWDRFYHVILPSDIYLIRFLEEIDLANKLCWSKTLTGFYVDKQYYSLSSSLEFLKFPPLSLLSKLRLAFTILYCSRINDWRRLEKVSVEDWLIRTCGLRTYEKIWKPLLLAKLGENYKRVSAVFIWSIIKRMYSARDSSAQREHLGYVSGGYKTILDRLEDIISSTGGTLLTKTSVKQVYPDNSGGLWIEDNEQKQHFDRVIFTGPVSFLQDICPTDMLIIENANNSIEYLGVICMVLITRKPLTPYYVLNITDDRIPFTGLIGMSNLVSLQETAGCYLSYLPKYVMSDDPLLRLTDTELYKIFMKGLREMFPNLEDKDIESIHFNRAFKVQPLQVLDYSTLVPKVTTQHRDFFVLNTSQFVNSTLNNNEVIHMVDEFIANYAHRFNYSKMS